MAERIKESSIIEELEKSYLDYSMSVIVGRALPDVRDGLKPVHRRILYAMRNLGLSSTSPFKKSATVVGEVLGKYHPHGDMAVYDALVRMAQDFSLRYPLIDGQGNFGSIDGDNAAAYRYTEARLSKIAELMLEDIDKNTVDFVPNFDASLLEPTVLPSAFPNLLVNGSSGIAVGMATNIPPHNLGEVCDGVIALIENPELEVADLMKWIKGPDFPTRGVIVGEEGLKKAYKTGEGKILVQAKFHVELESHGREKIIITEIPYQINKETLLEQIAEAVNKGKIDGIAGLRDESDQNGIRVVLLLKKNADSKTVLRRLLKYSDLRKTFGIILLAIVNGVPKKLSLKQMIQLYIEHRRTVVRRRCEFDLDKAEKRAHILEGLLKALDKIDEIIETIKKSKDREKAKENLMRMFEFSGEQAEAILDMRLARLTSLERDKLLEEYEEKIKLIEKLKSILASPKRLDLEIIEELKKVKEEFGDPRRTEIIGAAEEHSERDFVKEEDVVITFTHKGFVKRMPLYTYRQQGRGGVGIIGASVGDSDYVTSILVESTHAELLLFTNVGRCYPLKAYEIPEAARLSRGVSLARMLNLEPTEIPMAVVSLKDAGEGENVVLVTKNGVIKKVKLSEFANAHSGGIIAQRLREGDELLTAERVREGNKILLASSDGQVIKFDESLIREMGRVAQGVTGMSIKEGESVVSCVIATKETKYLFFVSDDGYGKRVDISEFRETNRGGKGVMGIKLTKGRKLQRMVGLKGEEDLIIVTETGKIIRVQSKEISKQRRGSRGVKVVSIKGEDRVTDVALVSE
ncbi:MAG: DNA gyrase subunit A [candidate division WOR-3 bacterium]